MKIQEEENHGKNKNNQENPSEGDTCSSENDVFKTINTSKKYIYTVLLRLDSFMTPFIQLVNQSS